MHLARPLAMLVRAAVTTRAENTRSRRRNRVLTMTEFLNIESRLWEIAVGKLADPSRLDLSLVQDALRLGIFLEHFPSSTTESGPAQT